MHSINLLAKSILFSCIGVSSGFTYAEEEYEMSASHLQHFSVEESTDHNMQMLQHTEHSKKNEMIENNDSVQSSAISSKMSQHKTNMESAHHREHGNQIYQATTIENKWVLNQDGQGELNSKLDTWIGSDENKLFIKAHLNKAESVSQNYDIAFLYSLNIADFWDLQIGTQYTDDLAKKSDQDTLGLMFGLHGMAAYFFETDVYMYVAEDQKFSISLETERDFLMTQKLIMQPYLDLKLVISDESQYAQKTGLSDLKLGVQTRYEVNKKFMPFIDIAYDYEKGNQQTMWQNHTTSESGWSYGAGILLKF